MPSLSARLAASLMLVWSTTAAAQEPRQLVVVARATTGDLSPRVVQTIARDFEPTVLRGVLQDAAVGKTPFDVITSLCGSVNATYFEEFIQANHGARISAREKLTSERAATLIFPACLRVAPLPQATAQRAASAPAASQTVNDPAAALVGFNALSSILPRGNPFLAFWTNRLTVPQPRGFVATPVELIPKAGTADIAAKALQADLASSLGIFDPSGSPVLTKAQAEMAGQIVEQADANSIDPNSQAGKACPARVTPFSATLAASAYGWSVARRKVVHANPGAAAVYIVDNGFFGANPNVAPTFSAAFPEELFPWRQEAGRVGPVTPFGAVDIYPSNYQNGFAPGPKPSNEAAHGTHVAGLAVGGPDFLGTLRSQLLGGGAGAQVTLTIINLGKGERYLVRKSHTYIPALLSATPVGYTQPKSQIVNMSIVYEGTQAAGILTGMFLARQDTLFVVAAGNSQTAVGPGHIYPAALGGLARANVISVAAHDASDPAKLAWFTNWGTTVDIAAPGCGVNSWFDGTDQDALTGTSQAAPLVTFTAALLTSLDASLTPLQVKARILASGDLLGGGDDRWRVASGSRLDVVRSLFLYDDVLVVRKPDPTDSTKEIKETWIGDIRQIVGFRCEGSPANFGAGYDKDTLWALKAAETGAELFMDRNVAAISHCKAALDAPAPGNPAPFVKFVRRARIAGDEVKEDAGPAGGEVVEISKIAALVPRGPNRDDP